MKHSEIIEKAKSFAQKAHIDQRRKYTGAPYYNHCIEVASIVAPYADAYDPDFSYNQIVSAALLHDTVEDTDVTLDDLAKEFGAGTACLVSWLTDISRKEDGNRKIRKAIDRAHISQAPRAAKTIKLADLISNSIDIAANDPDFAKVYMREKAKLLLVLTDAHPELFGRAMKIVMEYKYGALTD